MAKTETYFELDIQLPHARYPIFIGVNYIAHGSVIAEQVSSSQVLIITNNTIAPLYLKTLLKNLEQFQCDVVILEDGEAFKSQKSLALIYQKLLEKKHHRDTTIMALGGGVIGDISGFAASTYHRGVRYIQIPTTLLSQVDSSVGGKTAINHHLGKNMIGSFYHPYAVFMDIHLFKTLPERELKAGFAEIIKYALIEGGDFFDDVQLFLDSEVQNGSFHGVPASKFAKLISGCCQIKARFVEADEKEAGLRALLNLGHTFAHAIETLTEYQRYRHGEAVAIGLYCAAMLSNTLGYLASSDVSAVKNLLIQAGLPYKIPQELCSKKIIELMYQDKKVKNRQLRFILLRRPGDCFIHEVEQHGMIQTVLTQATY